MLKMNKSLNIVLTFILTHLGLIYFLYPGNIIASTSEAHWIPIAIGLVVHLTLMIIFFKGLSFFPQKNLIDILRLAGKRVAFIILSTVIISIICAIIVALVSGTEVVTIVLLSNTPQWTVALLLLSLSSYLSFFSYEAIFRTGFLVALLFLPLILIITFVSFQNADWYYLFPLVNKDFTFFSKNTYLSSFYPVFGGFLYLGFIQSHIYYDKRKIIYATLIIAPFFFIAVYGPLLTFGQATASRYLYPFIATTDTVNLNWLVFDRVTIFFLACLFVFLMLFISIGIRMIIQVTSHYLPRFPTLYTIFIINVVIHLSCTFFRDWNNVIHFYNWASYLGLLVVVTVTTFIYFIGINNRRYSHDEV